MRPKKEIFDTIVVGGGASGLMAAGRAAELGSRVLLLEKNPKLGEKLRISGGGRCNITNAEMNTRALLRMYGSAEPYLYSLFSKFGVKDTFEFFESREVPLMIEDRKRAFPKSERAVDVLRALEVYVRNGKAVVRTSTAVTQVRSAKGRITGVVCGDVVYEADTYIFATGSLSHPETGSTGDGFAWLRALGHTVKRPTPTIVPLRVREEWIKTLAGVALGGAKITFFVAGKKQFSLIGRILCTHFGLSGPLILNAASRVADLLHQGEVEARIDLYPKTDLGALERRMIGVFDNNKNKLLKNVLGEMLEGGLGRGLEPLVEEIVPVQTPVHSVLKEERKLIVRLLKDLPLTIGGLMGFDRAVIADGGVPLDEIDMRTMRSNVVDNLYVIGDLLHINRPSGGYSLQLCWSSGYVAGSDAAQREE